MDPRVALAIERLLEARRGRRTVPALDLPDAEAAYAVQDGVARALGWFPQGPARHWKSGGPPGPEPLTHAPLPEAGVWASPATAGAWPFAWRGVEAELALRLSQPVTPAEAQALTVETARLRIDAMAVAIELVDSRWIEARKAPPLARLADLQSHGALVLGAWLPWVPRDWQAQVCEVQVGVQATQAFRGSHPLGDPAAVLPQWLRHATRGGLTLPAGSVVSTGSWCGLLMAQAGEAVRVQFPGLGEARVQL